MDPRRFDTLARSLAAPKTRRGFLVALGAALAGARAASAQNGCPPGQTPNRKGECRCPAGTDACPDGCYDLERDPNHCGACASSCAGGECRKGECRCPNGSVHSPELGCVDASTSTTEPPTTTTTTTTQAPTTTSTTSTSTTTPAPTTTTTTTAGPTSTTTTTAGPTTTTTTTRPPAVITTGELTESDRVTASDTCGGIPYRYDTYTFDHPGGAISLAVRGSASGGGTLPNPTLTLFAGGGLPGNVCSPEDQVAYADTGGCVRDVFIMDVYLERTLPAGTYTAMVAHYTQTPLGSYTFERNTFTGANVCPT